MLSVFVQRSHCGEYEEDQALLKPSNLCGIHYFRSLQSTHMNSHGEKLWTRMRAKRLDLENFCIQNGERITIDLYRS